MNTSELKEHNDKILSNYLDGYITVLIDYTYNRINLYNTNGLDPINDLGENFKDWYNEDLFNYCELDKSEIIELAETFILY